ncbi:MAG: N-acetylmuramoyl-L-alanine amidase [Bacteroidia bacterium]|nr:N-acetylmuramoyl-L-alanine amidase [Bacteroidia bacterium]
MRILIFVSLIYLCCSAAAQHPLVTATAQKGDGVLSFLDKYQLETPCNKAYFYKVNKLTKTQGLQIAKSYQLPLLIYTYNGQSIRSTTGVQDIDWAEAVKAYNDRLYKAGLKPGDYRQDRQLWVPYSMLYCREEPLSDGPFTADTRSGISKPATAAVSQPDGRAPLRGTYPIFGEAYAKVPLESTELNGCVYYIVSGHGGPDPGAVGRFGDANLCEDEYAYDISLRMARNLLSYGATVYIIVRDSDDGIRDGEVLPCDKDEKTWMDLETPVSQSERLTQRSDVVNALYQKNKEQGVMFQRLIEIHVDSDHQTEQIDMFFYHRLGDEASKAFAQTIHQTIKAKYDEYRKGRGYTGTVSGRDLHMLRETEPTAVFIELGNIRNRNDQARLVIEGNRQLIANWLMDSMLRDARQHTK